MGRPSKKDIKDFNQYLVDFEFYFLTSITKQKSLLKLQLFAPHKSPDEAIHYTFSIVESAWKSAFNLKEFNKKVMRFKQITHLPSLNGQLAKENLGLTDEDKIKNLANILKQHLIG